jgi:hypothetical protein
MAGDSLSTISGLLQQLLRVNCPWTCNLILNVGLPSLDIFSYRCIQYLSSVIACFRDETSAPRHSTLQHQKNAPAETQVNQLQLRIRQSTYNNKHRLHATNTCH